MLTFLNRLPLERLYSAFFALFLFASTLFCGFTRVNNIFHVAAFFFVLLLFRRPLFRQHLIADRRLMTGLILAACYLIYFSLSNLWSTQPSNIESTLKHSLYLLLFLAMMVTLLNGRYRPMIYLALSIGFTGLAIFLISIDHHVLTNRLISLQSPGPDNVIDVGGYFAIGIILSLMAYRDLKNRWIWLLPLILLTGLLLTQSRGPLIALFIALLLTSHTGILTRRNFITAVITLGVTGVALSVSGLGSVVIDRFIELAMQVYLRLSIWQHSLQLISEAPFFGHGFDAQLHFTNYSGEFITTTHNLYLGTLLKGGVVGFIIMLLLIGYGLRCALHCVREGRRLEAALFLFMLIFYLSQGIFNIGNPAEFWYLFWFPLGLMMTAPRPATTALPAGT